MNDTTRESVGGLSPAPAGTQGLKVRSAAALVASPRRGYHSLRDHLIGAAAPMIVLMLVLGVWQFFVTSSGISGVILPGPADIWKAAVRSRGELLSATMRTSLSALSGLTAATLIGTLTAFLFSQSVVVRRALFPYALLLQTVPIIAVAPIIVVSLGRGFLSISLIACIISLFPIITNTTTGLLQIDANLRDVFRLHRASWWQVLFKLRLPSSLPYLLTGVRIGAGSAIVGAIVGEFFVGSGQPGLGALIQRKTASLAVADLYAAVIAATLLGTAVFAAISVAGEWFLRRWFGMSLSGVR